MSATDESKQIKVGPNEHTIADIKAILAGYALGSEALRFNAGQRSAVGDEPLLDQIPRWAYRSYDCVPATSGPLTALDILLVNGLNGQLDARAFHAITAVAPQVDVALTHIPAGTCFWNLDRDDLAEVPVESSAPWWIWRAWWILRGTPHVGIALTHKVLHHKRPAVFPLLDNKTRAHLGRSNAWLAIYDDLNRAPDAFDELERWFADLMAPLGGVPITRLRIHDIVLWCDAVGDAHDASIQGAAILEAEGIEP